MTDDTPRPRADVLRDAIGTTKEMIDLVEKEAGLLRQMLKALEQQLAKEKGHAA